MCDRCAWAEAAVVIKALQESGKVIWAHDFLQGTLRWVEQNRHVTDKQKQGVARVAAKAGKKYVQRDSPRGRRTRSGLFPEGE